MQCYMLYITSVDVQFCAVTEVQGDQRKNFYEALTQWNIVDKELVKVHGF